MTSQSESLLRAGSSQPYTFYMIGRLEFAVASFLDLRRIAEAPSLLLRSYHPSYGAHALPINKSSSYGANRMSVGFGNFPKCPFFGVATC